jgi:hypothetical protein
MHSCNRAESHNIYIALYSSSYRTSYKLQELSSTVHYCRVSLYNADNSLQIDAAATAVHALHYGFKIVQCCDRMHVQHSSERIALLRLNTADQRLAVSGWLHQLPY